MGMKKAKKSKKRILVHRSDLHFSDHGLSVLVDDRNLV